jgi:hypothetical protein
VRYCAITSFLLAELDLSTSIVPRDYQETLVSLPLLDNLDPTILSCVVRIMVHFAANHCVPSRPRLNSVGICADLCSSV